MTKRRSTAVERQGMNMLAESHFYFHKAADAIGVSDRVRMILLTPHCTVKVGINCDPHALSERDPFQITIRFVEQMKEVIDSTTDIPAPDVNTNATIMGWIMHVYSRYAGFSKGQAGKVTP